MVRVQWQGVQYHVVLAVPPRGREGAYEGGGSGWQQTLWSVDPLVGSYLCAHTREYSFDARLGESGLHVGRLSRRLPSSRAIVDTLGGWLHVSCYWFVAIGLRPHRIAPLRFYTFCYRLGVSHTKSQYI